MQRLSENKNIFLDEDIFLEKYNILELYRLQKILLVEQNIVASLIDCYNIWQRHSNELKASWLFFPDDDSTILIYIMDHNRFTSFEDYC